MNEWMNEWINKNTVDEMENKNTKINQVCIMEITFYSFDAPFWL